MANPVLGALKTKMHSYKMQVDSLNQEIAKKQAILQNEEDNRIKAESEVAALQKRIRSLEDELESTETRLQEATGKLEEASKAADESDRARRVLEALQNAEDERALQLGIMVREAAKSVNDTEAEYEEATRKLAVAEVALSHAEDRIEAAESRAKELQSLVQTIMAQIKSLQHQESQLSKQRTNLQSQVKLLSQKLNKAEQLTKDANQLKEMKQVELCKLEETLDAERLNYVNLRQEVENMCTEVDNI